MTQTVHTFFIWDLSTARVNGEQLRVLNNILINNIMLSWLLIFLKTSCDWKQTLPSFAGKTAPHLELQDSTKILTCWVTFADNSQNFSKNTYNHKDFTQACRPEIILQRLHQYKLTCNYLKRAAKKPSSHISYWEKSAYSHCTQFNGRAHWTRRYPWNFLLENKKNVVRQPQSAVLPISVSISMSILSL